MGRNTYYKKRATFGRMLGFKRKAPDGGDRSATVPEQVVDDLAAEFEQWTDEQRRAFAEVLCRLIPKVASESGGLTSLPLDRVLGVLKRNFWRLIPSLAMSREKTLQALGHAFLTRGQRMRDFCARAVRQIPELAATPAANDNGKDDGNG